MRNRLIVPIAFLLVSGVAAQDAPKPDLKDQGGAGDLLVAPTRLVIEKGQRVAEVVLFNQGAAPDTYRISLLRTGMNADGSITEIPDAPAGGVDPVSLFRFSPHEVKLEPGETQVVRIALRLPDQLPDGEYRVHVRFIGLPPVEPPKPKDPETAKGLTAVIRPVFGVSIPLIYRKGDLHATASLASPTLVHENGKPALSLDLGREGNASLYGDFKVFFRGADGVTQAVGELNGLAVYTPLASRHVTIPLNPPKGVLLQHGALAVSFVDGKSQSTLATTTLPVP